MRSSVLSWRDFLIQNIPPGEVHEAVKPKTAEEQGIVSMPFVAAGQPEILIQGERVEIGRTVFRITEESSFRDESGWRSLPGRPVE